MGLRAPCSSSETICESVADLDFPTGTEEKEALVCPLFGGGGKKGASAGGALSVKCCWKKSLQVLALKMDGCFLGPGRAEEDCQGQTELLCCLKSA